MMMRALALFAFMVAALAAIPAHASAYCRQQITAPAPLAIALVPEVQKAFGLQNMDAAWVQRSTVTRCMGGKLWACNMGANLPCGKANTTTALPAGDAWCRQNANSDFIPAYITGHDSAEQWRCTNGKPATTGQPAPIDGQGYFKDYWKVLE